MKTKPEFDKETGFVYKSGYHKQARLARDVHSGIDPDEGINACRGMLFSCLAVLAMIGLVWWLTK